MRNLLRIIILLTAIIIFFNSCKRDCYRDLTTEEMNRLAYSGGEQIIFKLNTGLIDTATAIVQNSEQIDEDSKCKDYGIRYRRFLDFSKNFPDSIFKTDDTSHYKAGMSIQIYKPKKKEKSFIYPEISFYGSYNFESAAKINLVVNGSTLSEVYALPVQEATHFNVSKIYFSFQYGLVRIDLVNGNYLERINL